MKRGTTFLEDLKRWLELLLPAVQLAPCFTFERISCDVQEKYQGNY